MEQYQGQYQHRLVFCNEWPTCFALSSLRAFLEAIFATLIGSLFANSNPGFLARRFFRLFKWIDCFNVAQSQLSSPPAGTQVKPAESTSEKPEKPVAPQNPESNTLKALLMISKFSLLGIYLFMEMFVIVRLIFLLLCFKPAC